MTNIEVYRIIEGPFHSSDVVDESGEYSGDFYFCMALVGVEGVSSQEEVRFDTLEEFHKMRDFLDKYIDPYEMKAEAF